MLPNFQIRAQIAPDTKLLRTMNLQLGLEQAYIDPAAVGIHIFREEAMHIFSER